MIDVSTLKNLSNTYFEEIKSCRRHLHQYPELSFQEYKTASFIAGKLTEYGISSTPQIAKTGIVAIIAGKNADKRVTALRADMDALPITEANDVVYKSQNAGVMHACGHDVHTSCLLGAAKILHGLREEFEGTVKCIFQPSEENLPGGANMMIAEGVLENPTVSSIFGQHVHTPLEVGKVGFAYGNCMAASDEIYITITGKGGHAAMPQDVKDPVMMAAQVLVTLQQVVNRTFSPFQPIVLSFGKIIGQGATNVIPSEVSLAGTLRTMDEAVRMEAHELIGRITKNSVEALGGGVQIDIVKGYPVLKNDVELTKKAFDRAAHYVGKGNVVEIPARMGAEDFAYYSHKIPACFYRLGTGNVAKGITSNIHTPTFNIDESALSIGMGLLAWQAIGELMH